jgi:hypothetical protein
VNDAQARDASLDEVGARRQAVLQTSGDGETETVVAAEEVAEQATSTPTRITPSWSDHDATTRWRPE